MAISETFSNGNTKVMSGLNEGYYENYHGYSVDEYVNKFIYSSESEMSRINRMVDMIPPNTKTVLDIGAGHGVFLELLEKKKAIKGVGIEITDEKVNFANKKGIDVRKGSADNLTFSDNSFDVVISTEVLEHLPFDVYEKSLKELERVAKKNVVISVPCQETRTFEKCEYCGSSINPSLHMRSYNDVDMHGLFENLALKKLITEGERIEYPSFLFKLRDIFLGKPPQFFACPICNFKLEKASKKTGPTQKRNRNFLTTIIKFFLGKKKFKWYLAIYNKEN